MKVLKSEVKRYLAVALAVVLLFSNLTLVMAMQSSSRQSVTVSAGELVADRYELREGEDALLRSGLLAGENFTYTAPGDDDGLVTVDMETKTVTAADHIDGDHVWQAITAEIIVGEECYETIDLAQDNHYTYDGSAFSVHVNYELYLTVDAATQSTLLNTAGWLKQGIANLDEAYGSYGALVVLEQAMPQLYDIAVNGYAIGDKVVYFADEQTTAIQELYDEMNANGGHFRLTTMLEEYSTGSKTQYLLENGSALKAECEAIAVKAETINVAVSTAKTVMGLFGGGGATYDLLNLLYNNLTSLAENMNAALTNDWTAAEMGTALVKPGISDSEYQALDVLVEGLGDGLHSAADFTIEENLLAAAAVVQNNMSMKNVTVVVSLLVVENVVGSGALVSGGEDYTVTLTLKEGVSMAEVVQAVADSGIEEAATSGWSRFVDGQYTSTVSVSPFVDALTEDITYTITYEPNLYTVTYGSGFNGASAVQLPYGYRMLLENHSDIGRVYDYYVNGAYYSQGSVYTVEGDVTITRESGKPYTGSDLYTVIANNFATQKEKEILTSGGLLGNETINVRYPDTDSGDLVTVEAGVLTAAAYSSDYEGKVWVPYSYTVMQGTQGTVHYFDGASSVTLTETAYDNISVVYRLVLDNFPDSLVLEKLNLPAILTEEAAVQTAALDKLSSAHGSMGGLDRTKMGALSGIINITDFNQDGDFQNDGEMQAYFNGIIGSILSNCMDTNGKLKIYNLLGGYLNGGLAYYYANGDAFLNEIDLLSGYLGDMLADDEKEAALGILVSSAGFPEYVDKISGLEQTMNEVKGDLIAPNAAIDCVNGDLDKLVSALEAEGETTVYDAIPDPGKLHLISGEFVMAASTKATVKVTLEIAGETRNISATYDKGYQLTQADISEMKASIDAALTEILGENGKYYDNNYVGGEALDALVDTPLNSSKNFTYRWAAKTYTVHVYGTAAQTISINNLRVELPAAAEPGVRYDYIVDGEMVSSGWYTFTLEQIDRLFASGSYSISRRVVDEGREKLENMVAELNAAVGAGSFVLTEQNGKYTRLTANVAMDGMMGMVMGLVSSGYEYVGLNHEGLIYMEDNVLVVSLQAVVDALLHDETFTNQTLIDLAANGSGKFLSTTMQLGSGADTLDHDLEFIINLTSVPAEMVSAGNALAGMQHRLIFRAGDGALNMELTLSESENASVLTGLFLTGDLSMADINRLETLAAYQFLEVFIDGMFGEDVTTTTLANTGEKMNTSLDLLEQEDYFQQLKNILGSDNLTSTPAGYELTMFTPAEELTVSLETMIPDPAMLNSVKSLVKECREGDGLVINANVDVTNFADENGDGLVDSDYEAVVLDVSKMETGGLSASAMILTDDLAACLDSLPVGAVVILQQDIAGDLNFKGTAMLDLNGCTVHGNVTSAGMIAIYDSTMDSSTYGGVTGTVAGRSEEDTYVLAGTYGSDVSAYLESGSIQDLTGAVVNKLFSVTEEADGSITINVNAGMLNLAAQPSRTLATMSLLPELMMKYGIAGSVTVDGTSAYAFTVEDMFAMMADEGGMNDLMLQINTEGMEAIVNGVLADLLDFAAVKTAVEQGRPVQSETVITAPWALSLLHDKTEDCLDLLVTPGEKRAPVTITVQVVGEQFEKDALAALNGGLANTVAATVTVNMEMVEDELGGVAIESSYDAVVVVDLTKSLDYAAIVGVMLAHNGVSKDAFVPALETYFSRGDADSLKSVLTGITFDQFSEAIMAMDKNVSFTAMATNIGLTDGVSRAAELEGIYHNFLAGIGWEMTSGKPVTDSQTLGEDGVFEVVKETTTVERTPEEESTGDELFPEREAAPYTLDLTIKVFGDCTHIQGRPVEENRVEATCQNEGSYDEVVYCQICGTELSREHKIIEMLSTHSYGDWAEVDDENHSRSCSVCGEPETAPHSYSGNSDATCNDCGHERTVETPGPGGTVPEVPSPGISIGTGVNSFYELKSAIANARDGSIIRLTSAISLTEDLYVDCSITIHNADYLNDTGYVLYLNDTDAGITSDAALNVGSSVDGCYPVRKSDTYVLAEISAPKTGGAVAGSKVEKLKGNNYLFLDLDPSKGIDLTALSGETDYKDLAGYTLKFTVPDNDGSGLVKTTDRLVVSAWNSEGRQVAQITYVVVVMGDTNCNGKVNSSDAAVLKNISMGQRYGFEIGLAADSNFSGTPEDPKVNSSDVAYIMSKWFTWDQNKYVSNVK